jgi:hypothetical protein
MAESEARWLGAGGLVQVGSHAIAGSNPGHLDLTAETNGEGGVATLGPAAARWAQSLLEVSRFELARVDDKASTLFRFYGVVAALSIGLLAGKGWSPTELDPAAQALFWGGCLALLLSGFLLGMTLYPRDFKGAPSKRLLYFGHVIAYQSVDELAEALRSVEEDPEHRLVEQLLSVSRLVQAKYKMMRHALQALGIGTILCIVGVIVDALIRHS